jgi:hypothetical protein
MDKVLGAIYFSRFYQISIGSGLVEAATVLSSRKNLTIEFYGSIIGSM